MMKLHFKSDVRQTGYTTGYFCWFHKYDKRVMCVGECGTLVSGVSRNLIFYFLSLFSSFIILTIYTIVMQGMAQNGTAQHSTVQLSITGHNSSNVFVARSR